MKNNTTSQRNEQFIQLMNRQTLVSKNISFKIKLFYIRKMDNIKKSIFMKNISFIKLVQG